MRFSAVAAAAAFAAGVSAQNTTSQAYVTEVVEAYTTYCPFATEITHGTNTYTVTEPTTLTISNCPCTITKPVITSTVVACSTCISNSTAPITTPIATPVNTPVNTPIIPSSKPIYPTGSNGTTTASVPVAATSSGPASATAPPTYTGAANKAMAASGAGLAAVFGFAAYIL